MLHDSFHDKYDTFLYTKYKYDTYLQNDYCIYPEQTMEIGKKIKILKLLEDYAIRLRELTRHIVATKSQTMILGKCLKK